MTIELNHDAADRALGRDYGSDDRRARPWLIGVVALAVIGTFCGIVWYAYTQGLSQGTRGGVPLLRADPSPMRERPAEPGGMKVPHQDKLIYDQVARAPTSAPTIERMLPPPETPIARPVAPPAALAPPPAASVTPVTPAPSMQAPAAPAPTVQPAPVRPPPSLAAPTSPPSMAMPAAPAPPQATLRPSVPVTPIAPVVPPAPPVAAAPAPAPPPVAAAPPASAPAPVAGGSYRIQLAAVRSQEAAQQEWEKMKTAHAPVLGKLSSQIVRVDLGESRGVFYRIQAGPFGDPDAARRTCTALKDRNVSCLVVRP
ncbi:sporulation related protein [Stella humosa]|uniref:Sporulation related protein n=1 Tax=Stella humosa TaxID=94 RepID=A0A3N1M853_9PROT|nr:SPOR domain-containing protein [Stella humosa]ROP99887.1 sporulation related protein [Stella humosa]BBK30883.1 hypothetical protein STHU_15170 [Stella humosa]